MNPAAFIAIGEAFLTENNYFSANYIRNVRGSVRSLADFCSTPPRRQVCARSVFDWTQHMFQVQHFELSTVTKHRTTIATVARWAIGRGDLAMQIVEQIRNFPVVNNAPKVEKVISFAEYDCLLDRQWWTP